MARTAAAAAAALKLYKPLSISPKFLTSTSPTPTSSISFTTFHAKTTSSSKKKHNHKYPPPKSSIAAASADSAALTPSKPKAKAGLEGEKRRTRSDKQYNEGFIHQFGIDKDTHFPVLLAELLDVFSSDSSSSSFRLRSFVDCTLGAAGHSSAIIQAHPELRTYIGLDVDPVAHGKARARINNLLQNVQSDLTANLEAHVLLKNFKHIKKVIGEVDDKLLTSGVDGILMDLGMSSMQVNDAGRGFSMLNNGPLDMRMDPEVYVRLL
ncbi:hypothetical protein RND81_08G185100 [Saponaria officinalis]|uniref:Uncharacterized protein n=1 Tax=Saponaria officinalis TaxID=3572 RepID=A0AAW1J9C8_SAPOF